MKKALFILLLALVVPMMAAVAQTLALGERAPELKAQTWLAQQQPKDAPKTYVEFFLSSNKSALPAMNRLKEISQKLGANLHIVVISRETEEKISPLLTPYLSPRISVGLDPSGKLFAAYGVTYVPFGVLLDEKDRAIWFGNTLQLTAEIIEKSK